MKILATADWHLGKKLFAYDLLANQLKMGAQIRAIARKHHVDALVIAGDVYDRANSSSEAVAAFQTLMHQINLTDHIPVLVISGNHDSATKLGSFDAWTNAHQLYFQTQLAASITPLEFADTQIFLLPYFTSADFKVAFPEVTAPTPTAQAQYVVEQMQQKFAPQKKHVVVAHLNAIAAAGSIGTADGIDRAVFAPFDFVVLGHVHNPLSLGTAKPTEFYCGSPLKMSEHDAQQTKMVRLIDTEANTVTPIALKQPQEFCSVSGTLEQLSQKVAADPTLAQKFAIVTITAGGSVPNLAERIRQLFPYVLKIKYDTRAQQAALAHQITAVKQAAPLEVMLAHFRAQTGCEPTDVQVKLLKKALKAATEEENE